MLSAAPLHNLPSLLPGETLYSWAGSVHAWNPSSDVRETSLGLYGTRHAALLHDFPTHVLELDRRMEGALGEPQTLALQRTLLGYFTACIPKAMAESILRSTLAGSCSDIKTKLGIPASRVGGYHPLKACVECIGKDMRRHGRAYWHVEHQFPSALLCFRHGSMLRWVRDHITPVHRRVWILPTMWPTPDWVDVAPPAQRQAELLARLADYSIYWAKLPPGALDAARLAATYRHAFNERGWVTAAGNLRLPSLIRELREHYRGLESLPGLGILRSIRFDWPGLVGTLARKTPRNGHPLKHLLMIALLFDDWAQFHARYHAQPELDIAIAAEEPDERETQCKGKALERFRSLVQVDDLSITAAARHLGVSTATGVRWATMLELNFTHRAKVLTAERLAPVRAMLRTGADKMSISEICDVSVVSINRLISSDPAIASAWRKARHGIALAKHRQRFLDLLASHPGWPIKQLRSIPGNAYSWLYRNDREWLRAHLPALWTM